MITHTLTTVIKVNKLKFFLFLVEKRYYVSPLADHTATHPFVPALIRAGKNDERKGIRSSSFDYAQDKLLDSHLVYPDYSLSIMLPQKLRRTK